MIDRVYLYNYLSPYITIDTIISLFYCDLNKRFHSSSERHDFWEFVYVDKGRLAVTTDNDEFIMEKGEIYFHKPMEFHQHKAIKKHPASICIASFHTDDEVIMRLAEYKFHLPDHCQKLLTQLLKYGAIVFSSLIDEKDNLYLVKNKEYPLYAEQMIQNYLEIFLMEILALTDTTKAGQHMAASASSRTQKNHFTSFFRWLNNTWQTTCLTASLLPTCAAT